ncbi:phospholipase, partial [Phaeodactylum tricornutum CCAP 1055/1]
SFSPSIFFVVLLPPIIFNSGYHLRRDLFFRNIVPICMYACIGTAVCTMVVASILYVCVPLFGFGFRPTFLELAAFGALISATDPVSTLAVFQSKKVDPHLFYLVFGESVINDAVGLVLFECLAHLIEKQQNQLNVGQEFAQFLYDFSTGFLGSLVLGTLFAITYALLMKHVDMRKTPFLELCVYITMMYFPFVAAEILRLSGIVTVLFTGIASKRYVEPNVCAETAVNADIVFRLVAHLTETIIFLDLGLSVFGLVGDGAFRIVFIAFALLACLVGRAVNIYPITYFPGESMTDDSVIPWKTAHMLWFSGLRGAVSYGLARMFPQTENQSIFIATTMFIVLTTTFVLGGATESALQFLN